MALLPPESRLVIEPLSKGHNRRDFHCGVVALDRYLKERASQDARKRVAAPFVLRTSESDRILGYYTLSMCNLRTRELPEEIVAKMPRYDALPAVLIGRLAVDRTCQGQGYGADLLIDALRRALENPIAAAFVVVDALDAKARTFYERYGFIRLQDAGNRLFLPMKTVARLFSEEKRS